MEVLKKVVVMVFLCLIVRIKVWVKNSGNETIASRPYETLHGNFFLCSAHFLDKYFTNSKKNGLAKTAVPTIFHGGDKEESVSDVRKASEESHNGHDDIVEESSQNSTENCDRGREEHFRINNASEGSNTSSNQEVFVKQNEII